MKETHDRAPTALTTEEGGLFAAGMRVPFVIEHRRFGIIADGHAAGPDFFDWFKSWYDSHRGLVYGRDWRCWLSRPTEVQREAVKWHGGKG